VRGDDGTHAGRPIDRLRLFPLVRRRAGLAAETRRATKSLIVR
jgi:hypothetical protein